MEPMGTWSDHARKWLAESEKPMDMHSSRETSRLRALLWVAPCIAAWSLIPKVASSTGGLDSLGFLFWSSLVSAACLLLCTAFSGNWRNLRSYSATDLRRIAALAALGTFGYYALLYLRVRP